jgi:uncharacterized membrane protein
MLKDFYEDYNYEKFLSYLKHKHTSFIKMTLKMARRGKNCYVKCFYRTINELPYYI